MKNGIDVCRNGTDLCRRAKQWHGRDMFREAMARRSTVRHGYGKVVFRTATAMSSITNNALICFVFARIAN